MPRVPRDTGDTLFCRIGGLTRLKEDLLTECFAATLQSDTTAANAYWRQITKNAPQLRSLRGSITITTQHSSKDRTARIDMRIIRQKKVLNIEHKLYAPEGHQQLPRYLSLPKIDAGFVAFVSADFRKVVKDVVDNPRYLRPSSRQSHFVWADLYPLVEASAKRGSAFGAATLTLMKSIDLAPVHPIIGDVRDPHYDLALLALLALWQPLIASLKATGWSVNSSFGHNRKSEIWIEAGPSNYLDVVRLDPFSSPTGLVVRLKADSRRKREAMLARLGRYRSSIPNGATLGMVPLKLAPTAYGYDWAIDVKVAWDPLLERSSMKNSALTKQKLRRYVERLMHAAARDAV